MKKPNVFLASRNENVLPVVHMLKLFVVFFSICYALKSNFVFHFKYPLKSYNIL
jgi:hypothetical protein